MNFIFPKGLSRLKRLLAGRNDEDHEPLRVEISVEGTAEKELSAAEEKRVLAILSAYEGSDELDDAETAAEHTPEELEAEAKSSRVSSRTGTKYRMADS
jgi:hypothetical protein